MTPEGKVKQFIKKYMKSYFPNAWEYSPPGGVFGKAGTPDLLYLIDGVFVAIEAKGDVYGKASVLQMKQLNHLKDNKAIVALVKGKDFNKMEAIRKLIDEARKI